MSLMNSATLIGRVINVKSKALSDGITAYYILFRAFASSSEGEEIIPIIALGTVSYDPWEMLKVGSECMVVGETWCLDELGEASSHIHTIWEKQDFSDNKIVVGISLSPMPLKETVEKWRRFLDQSIAQSHQGSSVYHG